jgi:hypothetical protein
MTDPEQNKSNVVTFYELMFNACRPREAVERFVGDDYIQVTSTSTGTARSLTERSLLRVPTTVISSTATSAEPSSASVGALPPSTPNAML